MSDGLAPSCRGLSLGRVALALDTPCRKPVCRMPGGARRNCNESAVLPSLAASFVALARSTSKQTRGCKLTELTCAVCSSGAGAGVHRRKRQRSCASGKKATDPRSPRARVKVWTSWTKYGTRACSAGACGASCRARARSEAARWYWSGLAPCCRLGKATPMLPQSTKDRPVESRQPS
eukprot:scaffold172_cov254-Pinguiococcus_pyrenoidosus.AAC.1